jgi:hypothetical protein
MRRVHFSPHAACQFPYNCSSQKNVAGSAGPPEDYRQAEARYRVLQMVVLTMIHTSVERIKNEERLRQRKDFVSEGLGMDSFPIRRKKNG